MTQIFNCSVLENKYVRVVSLQGLLHSIKLLQAAVGVIWDCRTTAQHDCRSGTTRYVFLSCSESWDQIKKDDLELALKQSCSRVQE